MQITVNAAMTVDGKIATHQGDSAISSKEDLIRVHKLRASVDGILVGISTVLADNPRLTVRLGGKQAKDEHPTRKIKKTGAIVIVAGTRTVNLKRVFLIVRKMGIRKILVEGGGEINWSLFSLGVVSELIVTIAPKIVGGRQATTLVEGDGYSRMARGIKLRLKKVLMQNGGELVLHYKL